MVKLEITKKIKRRLAGVGVFFLGMLYVAASEHVSLGMPYQQVMFNDVHICDVAAGTDAVQIARDVRKEIASESEEILAIDYRIEVTRAKKPFVALTTKDEVELVLRDRLADAVVNNGIKSYTLEIEGYTATFANLEEVKSLFRGVKDTADEQNEFEPVIVKQDGHVNGVLTASLEPVVPNVWESDVIPEEKEGDGIFEPVFFWKI